MQANLLFIWNKRTKPPIPRHKQPTHITHPRTLTQRRQVSDIITTNGKLGRDSHAFLTNYRPEDSFAISLETKFKSALTTQPLPLQQN